MQDNMNYIKNIDGPDVPLYLTVQFRPPFVLQVKKSDKEYISQRDIDYQPHEINVTETPFYSRQGKVPTPAEIEERAAEIRDSWDADTERFRRTGTYEMPELTMVAAAYTEEGLPWIDKLMDMSSAGGGTNDFNGRYGEQIPNSVLTEQAVRDIRSRCQKGCTEDYKQMAEEYGVTYTTIHAVMNRRTWKHIA